jgi:5'-nucleotidase
MKSPLTHAVSIAAAIAALSAGQSASALTIALSNDDGWSSRGIQAMKSALVADHTVILAAPLDEQSASSAALNTDTPALLVTKQAEDGDDMEFSVATIASGGTEGGEPASSALIALSLAPEADLLITGINAGANIGAFTQISGTVGAATMGLNGTINQQVPAIAVSSDDVCDEEELAEEGASAEELAACAAENDAHYAAIAQFVASFIDHLQTKPGFLASEEGLLPVGVGLNINYPPVDNPKGVVVAAQGQTAALGGAPFATAIGYGCYADCAGAPVGIPVPAGINAFGADPRTDVKNSDTDYYIDGYITVVPFQIDYTAKSYLKFKSVISGFNY